MVMSVILSFIKRCSLAHRFAPMNETRSCVYRQGRIQGAPPPLKKYPHIFLPELKKSQFRTFDLPKLPTYYPATVIRKIFGDMLNKHNFTSFNCGLAPKTFSSRTVI